LEDDPAVTLIIPVIVICRLADITTTVGVDDDDDDDDNVAVRVAPPTSARIAAALPNIIRSILII
jgi:hypothetical protein